MTNKHSDHISSSEKSSSGGKSPTLTAAGLTKPPYLSWQVKYLWPPTEPSFFPLGSSYSTPTHQPGWKWTLPANPATGKVLFSVPNLF